MGSVSIAYAPLKKGCILKYVLRLLPHQRSKLHSPTPYLFAAFGPLFTHSTHNTGLRSPFLILLPFVEDPGECSNDVAFAPSFGRLKRQG